MWAPGSRRGRCATSTTCCGRSAGRRARSRRRCRASTRRARSGRSRSWCATWSSPAGRGTAGCGTRRTRGCATTGTRPTSYGSRREDAVMSPASVKVPVDIEGRTVTLSNLDKVLYPEAGFTKAQVLDYYTRIAPVLLPHLRGRPFTSKRYPDGVEAAHYFNKNAPSYTPEWVRTARVASPGSTKNRDTVNYIVVDDLATLVWVVNLATLEMHTPMWRVDDEGTPCQPDLLVFDFDPGAPATIVECCGVALLVREVLEADGLEAYPKTSGSKGLQVYVPIVPGSSTGAETSAYAKA